MKKSFESIWTEGFIDEKSLMAPQINNLYNRKSLDVIESYKLMFKRNIKGLFFGSIIMLLVSFLVGLKYMGIPMFFMLNAMVLVDKRLLVRLNKIDNKDSCYDYLLMLKKWILLKTEANIVMARILYPVVFISLLLGFWFMNIEGQNLGELVIQRLLEIFPDLSLIFGFPTIGIIIILLIVASLIILAKRLYTYDIKVVYGRVLAKIDELIKEIEELRN